MAHPRVSALPRAKRYPRRIDLRSARLRAGLTQVKLSRLSGVDQGQISKMENGGVVDPSMSTVWRLARALDLDPAELRFDRDGGPS